MSHAEYQIFKRPSFGLAGVIITGLLLSASFLQAQTSLTVGNTPGYPATTVPVPITVRKATNLVAAQFDLSYNPTRAMPAPIALAGGSAGNVIRSREISPGIRRTVIFSMNNALLRTNGFNATVPIKIPVAEHTGSGPISPDNVILANSDGTEITPISLNSGAVFVRPVNPLPQGSVQFFLPSLADERYLIQASTNLLDWVNVTNVLAGSEFMDLVDSDAAQYPQRFYRPILYEAAGEIMTVTRNGTGQLSVQVSGLNGRTYILQASTDLRNWTDVGTNMATLGVFTFTPPIDPGFPSRFYRLKSGR